MYKVQENLRRLKHLSSTKMPSMVRPDGKAKKIAYDILGTPEQELDKKKKKRSNSDKRLEFEEQSRVR